MGSHKKRAWGLVFAFTVVAGTFFLFNGGDTEEVNAETSKVSDIQEDLTVKPGDILPEEARCDGDEFIPNSLPSTEKRWSDAVSVPFEASAPDEMLLELFAEHCGNPTLLDMSIQALSDLTIGEFNIGENNPWMGEFLAMAEEDGLRTAFLTLKEGEEGIYVTEGFQSYAEMTNTLVLAFSNVGVQERASVQNWHIGGPVAGELPRTVLNDQQEAMPSLVLEYTVKDNCPLVAIGYNVGDKRFEVFPDPVCEEPPPTVTTQPLTETTKPPSTTSTTKPPRTTTTTVPPTTLPTHPPASGPPPVANQPPHAPPATNPTTTTTPSGGPDVTVPACGLRGQPSCDNTGVTPPTTVAPPAPPPPNQPPQDGEVEGP